MSFRLRHEWPELPARLLAAELATCSHCGTLRVTEAEKPTRYLQQRKGELLEEPPCLEAAPRRKPGATPREALQQVLEASRRPGATNTSAAFTDDIDRERNQG